MLNPNTLKIAILGAGKGGCAILDLLSNMRGVTVVGVADKDPLAPGLRRATDHHIKVTSNVVDLIEQEGIDLIVDVTGDPAVQGLIREHNRYGAEVLGGAAARLLWQLTQYETQIQAQLFNAEKLASIGTFASGLAHDINNPLYLILGLAENLLDETDPAAVREHARDIGRAVQRISGLTTELTHYARYPRVDVLQEVELSSKLDEALRIARYATALHEVTVVRDYAARPTISANPDDVIHTFVNLLTNAIHAMDGKGTLTLATGWANGAAKVSITDTGCGIPQDHMERIFDPFFTTKPPGKGTGLGLHNVRTIVNRLRGRIAVESEVGKGTTFHLEFQKA